MIADAGQQQHDRALCSCVCVADGKARRFRRERSDRARAIGCDDETPVRHRAAAALQSECGVVQIDGRIAFQKFAQPFRGCGECRFGAGRKHEQVWTVRFSGGRDVRRFFEDDVRVRSAHSCGHDACASRAVRCSPRSELCVHKKWRRCEIDFRIRL